MCMSKIWRWLMVLAVLLGLSGCGGGGSTVDSNTSVDAPSAAKLISVSSADKGTVYVEWLPSADESLGDIYYEVHLSTQKDFVPTSATKRLETTEKEVEITGLIPGETYYVIVRTRQGDTYTTSLPLGVKIAETEAKFADGVQVIVHESSQIVAADNTTVTAISEMKAGDYIVGDAEHIYLRKVVSVDNVGGNYVAQTEVASLGEVYSSLEFSTSYKLEDTDTIPQASTEVTQDKYKSSYVWNSGSKLSSEYFIDKSIASAKQSKVIAGDDIEADNNDYYKISMPTVFSANLGDTLRYDFSIVQTKDTYSSDSNIDFNEKSECEAVGGTHEEEAYAIDNCLDIPVKICSATYRTTDVDDSGTSNLPYVIKTGEETYAIEWRPDSTNTNKEYLVDVDFKIGLGDCTGKNEAYFGTISLEDIKLIAGDDLPSQVSFAKDERVEFSMGDDTLNNTLTATFSPEIIFDGRFIDSDLEEANAKLHVDFGISDIANLHLEADAEHTFAPKPIYTKRFTKIVMAGVVPIVLTGQLKLMAVAKVESSASVDATLDTGMNFTLDYGLHYNGEEWEPIKEAKSTYHVKLEAEGHTETTMTVTLIPDFNIEVYELAAAHLLAEPYFYATVGVEGKVTAQAASDDNTYIDINAQFEKMEAGAGMDLKVYAGAAWKTKLKSLRFPEEATYASITDSAFMASLGLSDYYDDTRKYKNYEVFAKTAIASIPTLTKDDPYYSELPPSGIDSRAIKVKVGYENIENPLYSIKIGPQYIITFDSWDTPLSITNNAQIIAAQAEGEYWVIPQLNADGSLYDTQVRFVGYSTLGRWARQTIDMSFEIATDAGELPSYWMDRYGITDPTGDKDGDLYSNIMEYQNGTDPNDDASHPSGEPDIEEDDVTEPVFTSPATVSVYENQTRALTLQATDAHTVTYGISEGDSASFDVDAVSGEVTFKTAPDYETKSSYSFTATATDEAGNEARQSVTIVILDVDETGPDTTPPVITILGDNPATLTVGESYSDAGATATDDVDGDVAVTIVSNDVDTATVGTYHVDYEATDTAGNKATVTREVQVLENTPADTTPPVITILGDNPATLSVGASYTDAGATATDDVDGDVAVTVVSNDVDTATVGTYYVIYSAKDSAGNETNATRVVNVINDDALVSLNNKVIIWKDEVPNDDGSDTQTYQLMLALYEDQTCSFVGLNLDIDTTEEAEETEEDTNQINVSTLEILTAITPCSWSSDDEVLSLVLTDDNIEVNVSLVEGTIKAGDDFDLLCDDPNGCMVEKVYDVAVLAENNISSHAITTLSDDGNIYTWYFNSDNTIAIYEDGNTTVQFEGTWTVSDSYIDILDNEGNVVLRASNTAYKTGDYLDFTYVKGYISDIRDITESIDLSAGLVAHYEFEGNANDSSGNGNNGTEYGGVSYVDGVIGQAGSFDGVDDYIAIPFDAIDQELSISFWMNTDDLNSCVDGYGSTVVANSPTEGSGYNHTLQLCNGSLKPEAYLDNTLEQNFVTSVQINANIWTHISYTIKRNSDIYIYVNGVLKERFQAGDYINNNDGYLTIADIRPNRGLFYKGKLDDLRIYDRVLKESEIEALYKMGQTVDLNDGLVAHYEFEGDANDSSKNGYDGEEFGTIGYVDGVVGDKAIYLSEVNSYIGIEKDMDLKDFTLSFFVSIDQKAGATNMFVQGANSSYDNEFNFGWRNSDEALEGYFSMHGDYSNSYNLLNKWTHIVYANHDGMVKLYINGELFYTYDLTEADENINIEYLVIGKDQDCMRGCFDDDQSLLGKMDDLRIYNRALNESEIEALYQMGQQ